MNKYIDFINSCDKEPERFPYSFTCSSKNIEERAIIAYMNYLKDNNIAYGRLLKDILYNSSIELFELSLPQKKCSVIIQSGKAQVKNNSDEFQTILENTAAIIEKLTDQCNEIDELKKIIKEQSNIISKLQNDKAIAATLEKSEKNYTAENEEIEDEIKEEGKFSNMTTNDLFGGI